MLISTLARHTRNLAKDKRASVLIDATGALADPLQGARVTLYGLAEKTAEEGVRWRFLARHSEAAFYADFPDFAFFRLVVEGAHYIGGFGRIFDLAPSDLLVPVQGASRLLEGEPGIVEHMNKDHADALELYATALAGALPGPWRMAGIDPEGCDIVLDGGSAAHPVRRSCHHVRRSPQGAGAFGGRSAGAPRRRRVKRIVMAIVAAGRGGTDGAGPGRDARQTF